MPPNVMPWSNRYCAKSDTFVSHGSGVLTDAEVIAGVTERFNHSCRHAGTRYFVDHTDVDRFDVTEKLINELRPDADSPQPWGRRAFLMFSPSGASKYELCIRAVLTKDMSVFYSRREAVGWLNEGVPADTMVTVEDTLSDEKRRNRNG